MTPRFPLALQSLLGAGHRPTPGEAVAIVLELCRQVRPAESGVVTPPLSAATVYLDPTGAVGTRGGVAVEDDQTASLLGHLLLELLDEGQPQADPVRRLAARAAHSLPGTSRVSVRRLAGGLRRLSPSDPKAAVRAFVERANGTGAGAAETVASRRFPAIEVRAAARRLLAPFWRSIAILAGSLLLAGAYL
ncbi:MAG TPA: hypothetical protein VK911_12905 [Vicinamibacterales bacterium]|nr:hypothetical protein [Vicinamibacterales bacterium]